MAGADRLLPCWLGSREMGAGVVISNAFRCAGMCDYAGALGFIQCKAFAVHQHSCTCKLAMYCLNAMYVDQLIMTANLNFSRKQICT